MAPEVAVAVSGQTAAQAKVGSAQPNLSHSVNVTTSKGKGKIIPRQGAKSRALVVAKTPLISEKYATWISLLCFCARVEITSLLRLAGHAFPRDLAVIYSMGSV